MLAIVDIDPTPILVAILGTTASIYAATGARRTKKIHDEVRTNHGLRAGEYLEKLGPLLNEQVVQRSQLDSLIVGQADMRGKLDAHTKTLGEHTKDDTVRFTALEESSVRQEASGAAILAALQTAANDRSAIKTALIEHDSGEQVN